MKNIILYILALPVVLLVWPMLLMAKLDMGRPIDFSENEYHLHQLYIAAGIGAEFMWIIVAIAFAMWLTI